MISDINVTPLVDIVLVLLIIMMVAAPLIANNPSIKVELPKASTGDDTQKSTISLTLRKDGQLYFNEDAITEADVKTRIAGEFARNREVQAIVAADRGVPYGNVMHLIDLVKSLGVTKFALNIDAAP
ncbi:MAG: biopolymer transporter ExbD [Myxococcales bacterium]|nr:biopolymer transporter ExbD [Myxococcales bacterium]